MTWLWMTALIACQPYSDIDEAHEFHGISLGSPLSQHPELTLLREEGDVTIYQHPSENLSFGSAPLTYVHYRYWDEHLYQIQLGTAGSKELLDAFTTVYGTPSFETPWEWHGDQVHARFKGSLSHKGAKLFLTDKALDARKEKASRASTP